LKKQQKQAKGLEIIKRYSKLLWLFAVIITNWYKKIAIFGVFGLDFTVKIIHIFKTPILMFFRL
jgi:hypothetical protein